MSILEEVQYGRDIKTVHIYNRKSIIFNRLDNGITCIKGFGMNVHPRRGMDVISRLSKSTIEDLSFYIGFVRSRILELVLV